MKTGLFCLLLFCVQLLTAQNPTESDHLHTGHQWDFRLGISRLRTLDRNNSSLVYVGNIPHFGIQYRHRNRNGQVLTAGLQGGQGSFFAEQFPGRAVKFRSEDVYGRIDSVSVPMRGTNTRLGLHLGFLHQLSATDQFRPRIGAVVSNKLFYPQGFTQPGLMNVASVSPMAEVDFHPAGPHYFSIGILVPILSLVSRSTYNNSVSQPEDPRVVGFFDQGTQWESLGKHREVKFTAAYHFRLSDHWRSGIYYDLGILENTSPRPLSIRQRELGISMQLVR